MRPMRDRLDLTAYLAARGQRAHMIRWTRLWLTLFSSYACYRWSTEDLSLTYSDIGNKRV